MSAPAPPNGVRVPVGGGALLRTDRRELPKAADRRCVALSAPSVRAAVNQIFTKLNRAPLSDRPRFLLGEAPRPPNVEVPPLTEWLRPRRPPGRIRSRSRTATEPGGGGESTAVSGRGCSSRRGGSASNPLKTAGRAGEAAFSWSARRARRRGAALLRRSHARRVALGVVAVRPRFLLGEADRLDGRRAAA